MNLIPTYNRKWLIYILSFFFVFTAVLLLFEYVHEKKFRVAALNEKLDSYAELVENYLIQHEIPGKGTYQDLDSLVGLIRKESVRITLINPEGKVLFDSKVKKADEMENHLLRPEIRQAKDEGFGTDIRISGSTGIRYYYYAKSYPDQIIRVSTLYDITAKKFIQPDRVFLFVMMLILLAASFSIVLITDKFGKSIHALRDFTLKALANKPIEGAIEFPENELGFIGQDIIEIYRKLNHTKEELLSEKSKLIRHLNMRDEGIAIFNRHRQTVTSNNHFIQYINHISDTRVFTADEFFRIGEFKPIFSFIDRYLNDSRMSLADYQPAYEITLNKGGKYFSVKSIVFQDRSFEVSVNDITKPTKRKKLKQQITENIAHELKTPVSSIKGFLETLIQGNTDRERTMDYLQRAYSQSCRLADLINDISLLTKIEEASSLYHIEKVNLSELINDLTGEIKPKLEENGVTLEVKIPEKLIIEGNQGLLYSVFRNLFDNAINYAGKNIIIRLENYTQDSNFHYFSFSDTGTGVPEDDLSRLFERFYRVDKGRDRKKGGTGLGLAIVKNAIQFHKGDISVKNRAGGGLEFLFTLSKDLRATENE